jgi:hypothetical protein
MFVRVFRDFNYSGLFGSVISEPYYFGWCIYFLFFGQKSLTVVAEGICPRPGIWIADHWGTIRPRRSASPG